MAITNLDFPSFDDRQIKELTKVLFDKYPIKTQTLKNKTIQDCTINNDVTGDLTGDVTGDLEGAVTLDSKTFTADDTDVSDETASLWILNGLSANVQLAECTPALGKLLIITCIDSTNTTDVDCVSGATFDGTNATATFDAADDTLVLMGLSATRWLVLVNVGSVAFS